MCGLFGLAGPGITNNDLSAFKQLGFVSQFRGLDGAGVFEVNTWNKHDKGSVSKIDEDFSYLQYVAGKKGGPRAFGNSAAVNFIMGHTRAATSGNVKLESTHPFEFKNIVGMHNGTLKHPKYSNKPEVDSFLLFEDISNRGIMEVLPELTDKDAYYIVMYDRIDKKVIFANNGQRPLTFAKSRDRGVMYWASEKSALRYILEARNGMQNLDYFFLAPGVWVMDPKEVRPDNATVFNGWTNEDLANRKKEEVKEVVKELFEDDTPFETTPTAKEVVEGNVIPFDEAKVVHRDFGTYTGCCGMYISPLQMYEYSKDSHQGYHHTPTGQYLHFKCPVTNAAKG